MAKTLPAIVVSDPAYARLAAILPGANATEKIAAYTSRTLAYWRTQVLDAETRTRQEAAALAEATAAAAALTNPDNL